MVFELFYHEKAGVNEISEIPYKHCLLIGVFQSISIIPGASRSAPTIMGGLALGMRRQTIVLFSFLLAVPTMIAASGFDLFMSANQFSTSQFQVLLVGFAVSFMVALVAIRFFLNYVKKHNFIPFGVYRIILVVLFYFLVVR